MATDERTLKPITRLGKAQMLVLALETIASPRHLLSCISCERETEHVKGGVEDHEFTVCMTCGQGSIIRS